MNRFKFVEITVCFTLDHHLSNVQVVQTIAEIGYIAVDDLMLGNLVVIIELVVYVIIESSDFFAKLHVLEIYVLVFHLDPA